MATNPTNTARLFIVTVFALAMAWVEAAVVLYLRTLVGRIEPYQENPFPTAGSIGSVELVREIATLIMLFTVGVLAGKSWRARWGYAAFAFGVWDIFYYVFLKLMCDWPKSLLDWDILFLVPLPWWGPVLAPTLIAFLMIAWGTLASQTTPAPGSAGMSLAVWCAAILGIILALFVFMSDALRVAHQGEEAIRNTLPTRFNWPLFCVAVALLSVPVMHLGFSFWRMRNCLRRGPGDRAI